MAEDLAKTSALSDDNVAGNKKLTDTIEHLKKTLSTSYAQNSEVQAMVKDVLLIWYSIKQLDATKADKKDMETYALEGINSVKNNVRAEVTEK